LHRTFTTRIHAETFAYLLSRITGDRTNVHSYCYGQWRVERYTGTRWVTA